MFREVTLRAEGCGFVSLDTASVVTEVPLTKVLLLSSRLPPASPGEWVQSSCGVFTSNYEGPLYFKGELQCNQNICSVQSGTTGGLYVSLNSEEN